MKAALLPALLASMMTFAPATAQTSSRFDVEWVAPPTAASGAPFQVKKYQVITQAVLRPAKLYALIADWTADGRPVLASGTQLVGARAAFPVAYTYRSIQRMTVIGGQSIGYHGCLVDRNADGRFEAMFMFPRPAGGMVLGGGYVPA
ncbi:MAG: hypothetical protein ACAH11_11040, partial [Sphingomonas sp.]